MSEDITRRQMFDGGCDERDGAIEGAIDQLLTVCEMTTNHG